MNFGTNSPDTQNAIAINSIVEKHEIGTFTNLKHIRR